MMFSGLDKDNLHHAYLIQGERQKVQKALGEFLKSFAGIEFLEITTDSFRIEDARNLKALGSEKSFEDKKKFFLISANSILREAQNAMLKLFEEPMPGTHFFVVVPDINSLLPTLASRFYVLRSDGGSEDDTAALDFLSMPRAERIEYVKEVCAEEDEEEATVSDSARAKALRFLNALEFALHARMPQARFDARCFEHIFKVRENLRMPGSSVKSLMESVALLAPVIE